MERKGLRWLGVIFIVIGLLIPIICIISPQILITNQFDFMTIESIFWIGLSINLCIVGVFLSAKK